MFKSLLILIGCAALKGWGAPAPSDLEATYRAALARDEGVASARARLLQAEAQSRVSRSGLFPQIALNGRYTRQDDSNTAGGAVSAFTRPDQYSASIGLSQAVFRGLAEYAELRRQGSLVDAEEANLQWASQGLMRRVAQAFYQVLAADRELANLKELQQVTARRLREIQGRVKIGRSRRGELLASESQAAVLEAQIWDAETEVHRSREALSALSGQPMDTPWNGKVAPSVEVPQGAQLTDGVEGRPDIVALRLTEGAAEESVSIARGGHLPSVDFSANYYLTRTGVLAGSKWDFAVTASFPLFSGFGVSAQMEAATESRKQAELAWRSALRTAQSEVRAAGQRLSNLVSKRATLKKAVDLAERNYKTQESDYRLGLVTNLDVLQALNTQQESRRLLDRAEFEIEATRVELDILRGKGRRDTQ